MEEELAPEDAYDEIYYSSNKIVNEGDKLEEILDDKRIIRDIKGLFRELCGYWVYRSKLIKHAYEKPFGYPGDYQIIEMIYNNKTISKGIGYCFDKYLLENIYANAVRARKEKMKEILKELITDNIFDLNILNIGCGSCREIRELYAENNFNGSKKIVFSLVDHDINALLYSNEMLNDPPGNTEYKPIRSNILDCLKNPMLYYKLLAGKDLIYSLGLFDYLPDRIMQKLIYFLYSLLNPKGKLIIVHPDSKTYKPLEADWFGDWGLYNRSQEELTDIVNNSGIKNFSLGVEKDFITKIIFFLIIEKNY